MRFLEKKPKAHKLQTNLPEKTAPPKAPAVQRAKVMMRNFADWAYDALYIVGIQTMRVLKRFHKRAMRYLTPLGRLLQKGYQATVGRYLRNLAKSFHKELGTIREGREEARELIQRTKFAGKNPTIAYLKAARRNVWLHRRFFGGVLNIVAPLIALFALVTTIQHWNALDYGLVLDYDGKTIATIENEGVFEQATEMVNQRMVHDVSNGTDAQVNITPTFTLSVMEGVQYTPASTICNQIIKQSNGIIEEATGLYVDGDLVGAVKSGADLTYILQTILNNARGDNEEADVAFTQNVDTITGLFPTSSLISSEAMKSELTGTDHSAVTYTVKQGDTASTIAQAHNMSLEKLQSINKDLGDVMHIGDLVNIEVAVPKLGVQLVKTESYQVTLPFKTVTEKDSNQYTDYSKVKTEGANGTQERVDKVTYVNGTETARVNVTTTTVKEPVDKVVVTGTKTRPKNTGSGVSSGTLMWPVPACRTITTYYSGGHKAIDISGNSYGKSIVAADGGTVTYAGYDSSYGYHVIIDHGNGLKTLYGHASKLLVSRGTKVSKGQTIALVGSTGYSTGPHCHFEVYRNGVRVNPLNYVKRP